MSRSRGTFNFAANFEVVTKAPMDARLKVMYKSDLIDPFTWKDGANNVWLYDGIIVSVANDPSTENNGVYFLKDSTQYTDYNYWVPLIQPSVADSSGTNSYTFQINKDEFGVILRDASGNLEIVKSDNSTYSNLKLNNLNIDGSLFINAPIISNNNNIYALILESSTGNNIEVKSIKLGSIATEDSSKYATITYVDSSFLNRDISLNYLYQYDSIQDGSISNLKNYIDGSLNNRDVSINTLYAYDKIQDASIASLVSGIMKAWNGLTKTDNSIGLGGTLNAATTINNNGFNFVIGDKNATGSGSARIYYDINNSGLYTRIHSRDYNFGYLMRSRELNIENTYTELRYGTYNDSINVDNKVTVKSNKLELKGGPSGAIFSSLTLDNSALSYDADYSSKFYNRSLPDVGWVKNYININASSNQIKLYIDGSLNNRDVSLNYLYEYNSIQDISIAYLCSNAGKAWNGLTKSIDGSIGLGGNLDIDTNINTVGKKLSITGDLNIYGNLSVDGSVTYINSTDLNVSDNIITINYGESGSGVSKGFAGIKVDRGQENDYVFIFDENSDTFRVGIENEPTLPGNTQAVATREDTPVVNGIGYWNSNLNRIDTCLGFEMSENGLKLPYVIDQSSNLKALLIDETGLVGYKTLISDASINNKVNRTNENLPEYVNESPLYNWYVTQGNLAPTGWRVPSETDFNTLVTFLGGEEVAGGKLKAIGTDYWNSPNTDATDEYGFTALPTGYRNSENGNYYIYRNNLALYLSSSESGGVALIKMIYHSDAIFDDSNDNKTIGVALRLMTNVDPVVPTITDYDGNIYTWVQIGNQYWLQQDWKCTHYNDGTPIPNVTDDTEWSNLTTGALCYYNNVIKTFKVVIEDSEGNIVKINQDQITPDLTSYQTKIDNSLNTLDKSVVGAINELYLNSSTNNLYLKSYIDGSLSARDASINYVNNKLISLESSINRIDSSINNLFNYNIIQDVSIIYLKNYIDGSLNKINNSITSINASINRIDSSLNDVIDISDFILDISTNGLQNIANISVNNGNGIYSFKNNKTAYLKSIVAGNNIILTTDSSSIRIDASGGGSVSRYKNTFNGTLDTSLTILASTHNLGIGPFNINVYEDNILVMPDIICDNSGNIYFNWLAGSLNTNCKYIITG